MLNHNEPGPKGPMPHGKGLIHPLDMSTKSNHYTVNNEISILHYVIAGYFIFIVFKNSV